MNWESWLTEYLERYQRSIFAADVRIKLVAFHELAVAVRDR
jgi:hypothetical protein